MHVLISTDTSNCAQFIAFVRYVATNVITEDIPLCTPLEANTTGEKNNTFMGSTNKYNIASVKCVVIHTGHQSGCIICLQDVMRNVTCLHCFLHQEALTSKSSPSKIK